MAAPAVPASTASAQDLHVLISGTAEWRSVTPILATAKIQTSPYAEYFFSNVGQDRVLFFHSGWRLVRKPSVYNAPQINCQTDELEAVGYRDLVSENCV
jgi:hypothetical protein